jgi:hypothetical protein
MCRLNSKLCWPPSMWTFSSGARAHDEPWPLLRLLLQPLNVSQQLKLFTGWGRQPHAKPPTWRARVFLSVWIITFDLSGMGDPQQLRYRRHSSQDHITTRAPTLRQSRDTYWGSMRTPQLISDPETSQKKYCPWNYERPVVLMAFQINISGIFPEDPLCI